MSALDELIYDRTQTDATYAAELNRKLGRGEALTAQELADWNAGLKGAYNAADMNRVDAAVRELGSMLTTAGYQVRYTSPIPQPEPPDPEQMELKYIESSGPQYINTGILPTKDIRIVMRCMPLDAQKDSHCYFGSTWATTGFMLHGLSTGARWHCGGVALDVTFPYMCSVLTIECTYDYISINGEKHNIAATQDNSNTPIYIFRTPDALQTPYDASYYRLYGFEMYQGEQQVRNFQPMKIKGEVGLYDTIGGQFYTSIESTPFIAGQETYTELTYIESNGTAYIDTGYMPNNNTSVYVKAEIIAPNADYTAIFGARTEETNQFWVYYSSLESKWGLRYGSQQTLADGTYSGVKNIKCDKNVYSVDAASFTFTEQTFQAPCTMYLFAANNSGQIWLPGKIRIYSCAIYDNGTPVRYYIPCTDQSGKAGLYDTVSGSFFGNSSSVGNLQAGPQVVDPAPPEPSNKWNIGDIVNYDTWGIYLKNVQNIREAYYTMPDTPELPMLTAPLKFDGANAIEKLLYDIQVLYDAMSAMYRKCGTFQSGANVQQLPLQRGVT